MGTINTSIGNVSTLSGYFNYRGNDYKTEYFESREEHIKKVKINPEKINQNAKVHLLSEKQFKDFGKVFSYFDSNNGGYYPLARRGKFAAIAKGELELLEEKDCQMVLPFSFTENVFSHEFFHHIFLTQPPTLRSVFEQAFKTEQDNGSLFIEYVKNSCVPDPLLPDPDSALLKQFVLTGEGFAYIGECLTCNTPFSAEEVPFRLAEIVTPFILI